LIKKNNEKKKITREGFFFVEPSKEYIMR